MLLQMKISAGPYMQRFDLNQSQILHFSLKDIIITKKKLGGKIDLYGGQLSILVITKNAQQLQYFFSTNLESAWSNCIKINKKNIIYVTKQGWVTKYIVLV